MYIERKTKEHQGHNIVVYIDNYCDENVWQSTFG